MDGGMSGALLGAVGGIAVLAIYFGFKRLKDKEKTEQQRRLGLWLINGGIILLAASMFLMLRS